MEKTKETPPKIIVSPEGESHLIYPEVLLVDEEPTDRGEKIVLKGSIVGSNKKFIIEIS